MNNEMLQVADAVAREKSVDKELVVSAMEQALSTAARRTYGTKHIKTRIDRHSGDINMFHVVTVVEEVEDEENEISLQDAQERNEDHIVGTELLEPVEAISLGRIAAQTAKQVINQKIREAERERVVAEFEPRVGEIISGIVKRVEGGNVFVDLGRAEAIMCRDDLLPRESYRQGDRVRGYLREVSNQGRGAMVYLSRSDVGMIQRLFEQEVPEIQDGTVEIQAIARDPGSRAKIAIVGYDSGIDPIGACVGMRGARVQAVVNELHGEKIDIIEWSADPAAFVVNALAPAAIERVTVDEEKESIEVAVNEDQLAIAIGRYGQNVRLASELTGWNIEIMSSSEEKEKREGESKEAVEIFCEKLDIDQSMASLLYEEGFVTLDDVAYCAIEEMATVEGFDAELASELQRRGRDALLGQALVATQEEDQVAELDTTLIALNDVDDAIVSTLIEAGVATAEDLADAAVDDLIDVEGLSRELIETLIIQAREACGWFD
ncbi:MAG: transcription termination factor NusA [Mariprofundaceae bacterium]|nr:transcription termination factor NusA [Mariprofundaceae bacterium]